MLGGAAVVAGAVVAGAPSTVVSVDPNRRRRAGGSGHGGVRDQHIERVLRTPVAIADVVDRLAGLGQTGPLAHRVEGSREADQHGPLPPVRLALGHVEECPRVQERRDRERDDADDQDLARGHRPAANLSAGVHGMVRFAAGGDVDVGVAEPGSGGCRDGPTLRDGDRAVRVIDSPVTPQNWVVQNWK